MVMLLDQITSLAYFLVQRAYTIAITPSRNQYIRTLFMTSVVIIFVLRAYKIWIRSALVVAIPCLALATLAFGFLFSLLLVFAIVYAVMVYLVHTHPDDGIGHRVGFKGYSGTEIENTIAAVEALAAADAAGQYNNPTAAVHFPFIEFDVRETKDGELVLFHDLGLKLAFPLDEIEVQSGGDENQNSFNLKPFRALAEQGIDWKTASINDLTLDQLRTLHLGGREGSHVPTLKEFLE